LDATNCNFSNPQDRPLEVYIGFLLWRHHRRTFSAPILPDTDNLGTLEGFWRRTSRPTASLFWLAIVVSAILFGLGHLPAAASIWALTPIVIVRTITLNALLGIPFGWLYWRWGLEYAMLSHFCADLVLHGIPWVNLGINH
jgi:hypothetical protein